MISKSILDQAKAFLCWDKFPNLSIQLVELGDAVAYFYPPQNQCGSIVLFYQTRETDYQKSLFLLFHEVGHYLQHNEFLKRGESYLYQNLVEATEGEAKVSFEQEAWALGQQILAEFLGQRTLGKNRLLQEYSDYSRDCIRTYQSDRTVES